MQRDILLTATPETYRACLRSAFAQIILPEAQVWEDQGHIPRSAWTQLASIGLLRLPDTGLESWRSALALEELGYLGFAGIRASIGVNGFMAPYYIAKYGSPELKKRFLSQIQSGQCVAALAITEVDGGSDLRRISCTAEGACATTLRVNGQKRFITNGRHADIFITLVKTNPAPSTNDLGTSSFLVIENTPRCVECTPEPMLGWRSADVSTITFHDCLVERVNLIGRPNMGVTQLIPALNFERLVAGTLALGGARKAVELGFDAANTLGASGRNLGDHQAVSHPLANHLAQLYLLEAYAEAVWRRQGVGQLETAAASALKLQASELELAAALDALRFGGANAYIEGATAARLHRDAVAGSMAAGPNEIIRDIIFREARATRASETLSHKAPGFNQK